MGVKKKPCDMGKSPFDEPLWVALRWCIKNDILISAKAKNDTAWYVVIKNKGKTNTSPDTYGKTEIWTKIFEYCKYYYEKHKHTK
jgi:hypothetical protein